jgi:Fic family protein
MTPIQYHYGKFPPAELDWKQLIPLLGPANAALARYDGTLNAVPNPNVLLSPLATQEAVLSSKIEGTISAFFERNRDEYYERLRAVSRDGAWTEWAGFFLKAIQSQAEENQTKAQAILKLYETKKAWMTESTRSLYSIHALDFLFRRPVFETSEFTSQKGIPTPTAHRILGLLRKHGMFRVLRESSGRRPGVLAFRELLNIVEGCDAF